MDTPASEYRVESEGARSALVPEPRPDLARPQPAYGDGAPRWLRLMRGTALEPVWMLRSAAPDGLISVGSDPRCDWQIHTSEMPPVACALRVLAGTLFVRASGACQAYVNGQSLGSIWVPLVHGARLSVGGALIEVGLFGRSRAAQDGQLGHALERPRASEAASSPAAQAAAAGGDRQAQLHAAWYLPTADASAQEPQRPAFTATVFGPEDLPYEDRPGRETVMGLRRFSAAGVWIAGSLLACAYGCWVLLLDHFHL